MPPSAALDSAMAEPWRERVVTRALGPAIDQALERAQAFMTAAVELMATSPDAVGVQDIADRAGMSLRLLYRHFDSKDDLVAAVLEDAFTRTAVALEERLARVQDPERRLWVLLGALVDIELTPLNRGFARHEAALMLTSPGAVARAQAPLAALVHRVTTEVGAPAGSAYLVMAAKRAYNWSRLFGSEFGLAHPTPAQFVEFHLRALTAPADGHAADLEAHGRRRGRRIEARWSNGFVAAAVSLMEARGDAFTVQDLCEASGLSMRHFYQDFTGKDAVLVAAMAESIAMAAEVSRASLAAITDPSERLSQFLHAGVSHTPDRLAATLVGLALQLSQTLPDEMARAHRPQVDLLAALVGEVTAGPAEAATALIALVRSAYNHSRLLGNELGLDMPSAAAVVAHCRRGLMAFGAAPVGVVID